MDIDFIKDFRLGFEVSLTSNPSGVTGNRALLNRFEITFLSKRRDFNLAGTIVQDNYGGDANKFIGSPRVLSDAQGISAAVSIAMDQTIESMKADEPDNLPNTERLESAELSRLEIIDDMITAIIKVNPVEVESYDVLQFNLPITRS